MEGVVERGRVRRKLELVPRLRAPPSRPLPSRGWRAGRGDCRRRTGGSADARAPPPRSLPLCRLPFVFPRGDERRASAAAAGARRPALIGTPSPASARQSLAAARARPQRRRRGTWARGARQIASCDGAGPVGSQCHPCPSWEDKSAQASRAWSSSLGQDVEAASEVLTPAFSPPPLGLGYAAALYFRCCTDRLWDYWLATP
ncbi:hippocalcin-like protein 1 isoform X1 [Bubalus bubalis]|uniref:hippocalcin-like protein 1 isoform X1 n=1 Tax=Bubalus bubalis TaxID=89462 RepID=UPI001D10E1BA|nr:hippocalcin-like protein 1 isoform X1 [Bubalus bubalis]